MATTAKRIKVITGYAGEARFYAETGKDLGYIPRQTQIPSPYHYSPAWIVLEFHGLPVILVETSHRRFEVFDVTGMVIYSTEDEAVKAGIMLTHFCEQCGRDMGGEWIIGPVCGSCVRANHARAVGR